ncbi:hypothetical protein FG386_001771 [Cryptosporidium ryanae]|uniref:uncharacterized protein n=1 Tax=Cryptosporidium ryanae TaxID=515981 RepID=UPI00351A7196|nr:hypothetical protein FG386_001771 [Cryptosporidium ryanae]
MVLHSNLGSNYYTNGEISINFSLEDFSEFETLSKSSNSSIQNFENFFDDDQRVGNYSFVVGYRDSLLNYSKKKVSFVSNIKKRVVSGRSYSDSPEIESYSEESCYLSVGNFETSERALTKSVSENFSANSRFTKNSKSYYPNNRNNYLSVEFGNNCENNHSDKEHGESYNSSSPILSSHTSDKNNSDVSSPSTERKIPIVEGYGPFIPRKSKQPPHIMLIVHGIGSNESAIIKNCEEFVQQLESVKAHWFWEVEIDITVDVVDWKSKLASVQDHTFDRITLPQHRENRMILNKTVGDVMYFMVPRYGDYIISEVAKQLNSKIKYYKSKFSDKAKIVLIGHSLGSIIVYELVTRQQTRITKSEIPKLEFEVDHLFLWGSPLPAMLVMMFPEFLRSGLSLPKGLAPIESSGSFILNKCSKLKIYNIFHPYDPIAFRLEPLLYPNLDSLPDPILLPYWRNLSKRTYHQWDKEMENARKALYEGISGITSSISNAVLGGILGWGVGGDEYKSTLQVNVLPKDQKFKQLRDESVISRFKTKFSAGRQNTGLNSVPKMTEIKSKFQNHEDEEAERVQFSLLKGQEFPEVPIRVDYQLQEGTTEHYISSLALLQSHFSYWKSRDLSFFTLWKIIENFEPVISHEDYKVAIEQLKHEQADLDNLNSYSDISDESYDNSDSN